MFYLVQEIIDIMNLSTGIWSSGKKLISNLSNAMIPPSANIKAAMQIGERRSTLSKGMYDYSMKYGSHPSMYETLQGTRNELGDQLNHLYSMEAGARGNSKYAFPRNRHEQNVNTRITQNSFQRRWEK